MVLMSTDFGIYFWFIDIKCMVSLGLILLQLNLLQNVHKIYLLIYFFSSKTSSWFFPSTLEGPLGIAKLGYVILRL